MSRRTSWGVGRGAWGVALLVACTGAASAQEPQDVERQVRNIVEQRPPQAENAARSFLYHIAPDRFSGPVAGNGMLDSLKRRDLDEYWMEVGRLTVQFEIFQNVMQRDTARAGVMARLFGAEFQARDQQRAWRQATESERRAIRARLEQIMNRHFDLEQQLRALEMEDIARRLEQARTASARRLERRAELVRYAVDGIVRDAERP